PGRLGGDLGPRSAHAPGRAVAGGRLAAGTLLRSDLPPHPALVGGPPRRALALGRRPGHGLGAGAGGGAGTGRAPGGGGDRRAPGPRPDRGGLEPADRCPGQRPHPAALRPGPLRGPDPGCAGRRLSVGQAPACAWACRTARMLGSVPNSHTVYAMKAGIHPEYREVVFHDVTSDFKFLTRSTLAASAKETIKWED